MVINQIQIGELSQLSPISVSALPKSPKPMTSLRAGSSEDDNYDAYCLSWRLAVEANNVRGWIRVPSRCEQYIERYMTEGQYDLDVEMVVDEILGYADGIELSGDGMDAWILDVDDTCISNAGYYKGKRYGCDPFEGAGFRAWATRGECPAIPAVLRLYKTLLGRGFKVFLITGRDEARLGQVTVLNLHNQGFSGYQQLVVAPQDLTIAWNEPTTWRLRSMELVHHMSVPPTMPWTPMYHGQNAVKYKSNVRRQLVEGGYRIWGNVGDQWSDLHGEYVGDRTFKVPNPMYYVS